VIVPVTQYRVSVAHRKSNDGVVSLHEFHFSPRYAASPAGESCSPYPTVCGLVDWIAL
jgi:hypothetical protein